MYFNECMYDKYRTTAYFWMKKILLPQKVSRQPQATTIWYLSQEFNSDFFEPHKNGIMRYAFCFL